MARRMADQWRQRPNGSSAFASWFVVLVVLWIVLAGAVSVGETVLHLLHLLADFIAARI